MHTYTVLARSTSTHESNRNDKRESKITTFLYFCPVDPMSIEAQPYIEENELKPEIFGPDEDRWYCWNSSETPK